LAVCLIESGKGHDEDAGKTVDIKQKLAFLSILRDREQMPPEALPEQGYRISTFYP